MADAAPPVIMKTLALFVALLAGSTIASADPKVGATQPSRAAFEPKKAEDTGRLVLGPRKPSPPPKKVVFVDGWTEVTDATPARFGTVFVRIGSAATPFAKLKFDAVTGTVMIRRVKVHFVDGTSKVFAVAKSIDARRKTSAVIDLGAPKRIQQLDITTDRRPAGEYSIGGKAGEVTAPTCC